jgi:hypothetical protein
MPTNAKAYDILAQQPTSALATDNWRDVVISVIRDDRGREHVLSRLGDNEWNLSPFYDQSNIAESLKIIQWPTDCPQRLVDDCKLALYAWYVRGRPGWKPPIARTIAGCMIVGKPLLYWLRDLGISSFDQVRPIHISNYIQTLKDTKVAPMGLMGRLEILDILWAFRADTLHPLSFFPWGRSNLRSISGIEGSYRAGKTRVIPREVQNLLFQYCERVIEGAKDVIARRDAGRISMSGRELVYIRDAALYLISIMSGMRNEEVIGIEVGAGRTEVKNGVIFHWVESVEYLVPEMALRVLETLEMYAVPLQKRLADEITQIEATLVSDEDLPTERRNTLLTRLMRARKDRHKVFLASHPRGLHVGALTSGGAQCAFNALVSRAGVDWNLHPHQCRRTYARLWVESKMGRSSLIFIKWQFKHSSMSMSELYASNPAQDPMLFDEMLSELFDFKHELLASMAQSDRPLSGGGGRKIIRMRAQTVKNRQLLLRQTAQEIRISPTGHGWCVSQDDGCGGTGLYDPLQCSDCRNGIIDPVEHGEIWKGLFAQQMELTNIDDCGPHVQARSRRDLARIRQVIEELGISLDEDIANFSSASHNIQSDQEVGT